MVRTPDHVLRRLALSLTLAALPLAAAAGEVPEGFTLLFDGETLDGWHVSEQSHHGNSRAWTVQDGVIAGTQDRPGNGGILLTDETFGDFEVYLEIRPDWGCDGGLFLRSNEKGQAYQVMIDFLEGGVVGGIYGEGLERLRGDGRIPRDWRKVWRQDDWNALRARIEGEAPRIQVWLNGEQIVDWTDHANHLPDGATEGMIALQLHFSNDDVPRWREGGRHRYRNVGVRRLHR